MINALDIFKVCKLSNRNVVLGWKFTISNWHLRFVIHIVQRDIVQVGENPTFFSEKHCTNHGIWRKKKLILFNIFFFTFFSRLNQSCTTTVSHSVNIGTISNEELCNIVVFCKRKQSFFKKLLFYDCFKSLQIPSRIATISGVLLFTLILSIFAPFSMSNSAIRLCPIPLKLTLLVSNIHIF